MLADGDLSDNVTTHSEKDILGISFSRMITRLRDVIRGLIAHTTTLDTGIH